VWQWERRLRHRLALAEDTWRHGHLVAVAIGATYAAIEGSGIGAAPAWAWSPSYAALANYTAHSAPLPGAGWGSVQPVDFLFEGRWHVGCDTGC
jgi:hypothetical protein